MIDDLIARLDNAARARGNRPMSREDWDLIDQVEREMARRLHPLNEILEELDQVDRMPAAVRDEVEATWAAWDNR